MSSDIPVSKMTLLRKRNAGIIGFYRLGRRVLYPKKKTHAVSHAVSRPVFQKDQKQIIDNFVRMATALR